MREPERQATEEQGQERRSFLATVAMLVGLVASYGTGLLYFLRYLVPKPRLVRRQVFVTTLDKVPVDRPLIWVGPEGQEAMVYQIQGKPVAFSNVCPHLGCHVHYQPSKQRFFCPCHNGVFDLEGRPISGPPADENLPLKRYNLVVRGNAVFVELIEEA